MKMNKVKLGDVAEINSKTFQIDEFDEILYLDTSSVTKGVFDNFIHLSKNDIIPSRAKRAVKDKTIVYSTVRPNLQHFGIFENPKENVVVSTGFVTIDVKDNLVDPKYLYYNLTQDNYTNALHTIATNNVSSYPSINPSDLENLELEIPKDIQIQTAIASVLSSLDDKIELNNKINKELENLAKTIYDYWFVQFDFPNEEGKPYRSNDGKMVWDEQLRCYIPKNWSTCQLKHFLKNENNSIVPGIHLQGQFYTPIDELPKRQMSFYGGLDGKEANSSLQTYQIRDILLGAMRVYFHRVCIAAQNGITRSTTMVLRPYNGNYLPFIYELLNQDMTIQYAARISAGTQQPYVNWEDALAEYTVILPEEKYILGYSKIINPVIEEVFYRVKENYELTKIRDFLLPLLMNGQVGVKNCIREYSN